MQEEEALTHWNKTDHTNLFSLSLFLSAFSFGLGRDSVGREHGSKQGIKWREWVRWCWERRELFNYGFSAIL